MAATATRIDQEIFQHERQFWDACKGDATKLRALCADNFTFVMGEGISNFKRNEFVDMMTGGDYKLKSYQIDESKAVVRELGPEAAVIAYPAKTEYEMGGKDQKQSSFYSSVWVKEPTGWKIAAVTESTATPAR